MNNLRHLVIINAVILFTSSLALSQWKSKNRLELGITDNATLSNTNKESDFLMALASSNSVSVNDQTLGMRLGYRDYNKENANDVLSWALSDQLKCLGDKTCEFQLKGQEYVYGEPMTTDSSFSNYGLVASIEKTKEINNLTSLNLNGSYEAKNYYSQNRVDNTASLQAVLSYDLMPATYLEALGESGIILSSNSDFSAIYFDLAGALEYRLNKDWELAGEIGVRQTSFLSRNITTTAQFTRGNKVVASQSTSKESYSALNLTADLNYHLSSVSSAGLSVSTRQQKSHSGYQDYSETEVMAKLFINY